MNPSVEVNTARIFAIAGPAMLANITTPLLGVVATTVIGRLGDAAILGGVAMASLVFDCIFWLFGFLRSGTVALTAQAFGARDHGEQRAVLARAMMTLLDLHPPQVPTPAEEVERLRQRLSAAGYRLSDPGEAQGFQVRRSDHAGCVAALARHLGSLEAPLVP